jgi:hypothetical protein
MSHDNSDQYVNTEPILTVILSAAKDLAEVYIHIASMSCFFHYSDSSLRSE